jgi:hypothetical protein
VITPDRLASWRRKATPELLDACNEIEQLQAKVDRTVEQASNHIGDVLRRLVDAEAARDLARDAAVALEQQLAEIKRLAYIGGQDDASIRRWIIGVFEKDQRDLEGGEG